MKSTSISTNTLAIVFFCVTLAINLLQWITLSLDTTGLVDNIVYLRSLRFLSPIVMTVIIGADMIKTNKMDWRLLVITFCTNGIGAALYPLWRKDAVEAKIIKNIITILTIIIACPYIYLIIKDLHVITTFVYRNPWTAYIKWIFNIIAVVYSIQLLRTLNYKQPTIWTFALILIFLNANIGVLFLLTLLLTNGTQHPWGNYINKYLVLFSIQTIYSISSSWILTHLDQYQINSNIYEAHAYILSLFLLIAIILLIVDTRRLPVTGKVWRLLPALFNPIYSIIAMQDKETNENDFSE